jgi:hypothetical protein
LSPGASCTVLIAATDLLPTLKTRTVTDDTELLAFSDTEALRALEVISRRRPSVVALERVFAATPRGAALINRIKADPTLRQSEIRFVSSETQDNGVDTAVAVAEPLATIAAPAPPAVGLQTDELDEHGTRRARRFTMAADAVADLNGNSATLVDLSAAGAQVVSTTILRPKQRVRMGLTDDRGSVRCSAVVAWASFEMPPDLGPRYRAGIEFLDANPDEVNRFCVRHRTPSQA